MIVWDRSIIPARYAAGRGRNPLNQRTPPRRPPWVDELLDHFFVQQALRQAWQDTMNDPGTREQGGWISINLRNGTLLNVVRARAYSASRITMSPPPLRPGWAVVATFHTHPSESRADSVDQDVAAGEGVPMFVVGISGFGSLDGGILHREVVHQDPSPPRMVVRDGGILYVDVAGPIHRAGNWASAENECGFPSEPHTQCTMARGRR